MSIKQFKFVSPGVFINEIDNSALPETSDAIGPTVIGRTEMVTTPLQLMQHTLLKLI